MKKIVILFLVSIISFSTLIGCQLKTNKNEKTIEVIKEQERKELENLTNIIATEEEQKKLQEDIQHNIDNEIYSHDLSGDYMLSNPYSNEIVNVKVDNVIENLSTLDDFASIWLVSKVNTIDPTYDIALYYSFTNTNNNEEKIKTISNSFVNQEIKDTTIEEITYTGDNLEIYKTYKIKITTIEDIEFYGYAYTMFVNEMDKVLCVQVNLIPFFENSLDFFISNYSNIE